MSRPCCGGPKVKIIDVNGMEVGLKGLEEAFLEVYLLGIENDEILKEELLERVKKNNFMSKKYEPKYAEALLREYKKFLQMEGLIEEKKEPQEEIKSLKIKKEKKFLKDLINKILRRNHE